MTIQRIIFTALLLICPTIQAQNFDILIIGDDVSMPLPNNTDNWIDLTKDKLSCSVNIYNASKNDATTLDGYTSLEYFLKKHKTKVIAIELGSNDIKSKQSLHKLEKNLNQMIELSQKNLIKIILLGVELPPNYGTIYRQLLKSTFERIAHQHSIELVLTEFTSDPNLVESDGIHPTTEGHQEISNMITPHIDKLACHRYA
jgi:acyl-CoA thioesterase-1